MIQFTKRAAGATCGVAGFVPLCALPLCDSPVPWFAPRDVRLAVGLRRLGVVPRSSRAWIGPSVKQLYDLPVSRRAWLHANGSGWSADVVCGRRDSRTRRFAWLCASRCWAALANGRRHAWLSTARSRSPAWSSVRHACPRARGGFPLGRTHPPECSALFQRACLCALAPKWLSPAYLCSPA